MSTAFAAIEVRGLSKRFGETLAVSDLSFTVTHGKIVGFLGPNGAGKTTTLRASLGVVNPTSGTALIEGRPYRELENPARVVGSVLDGGMLHPGRSGRNHLRMLAAAAGIPASRCDEMLSLVGLSSVANRRAGGYSLGMRQRLGLAAALLGDPGVLILDEPANGLDPQGIRWLRDFLKSLAAQGRAVLVSSHLLSEVSQTVDDVVVISRGRSIVQSSLEDLLREQAATGTRIAGPDVGRLADRLRAEGADVKADPDGSVVVTDRTGEEIGELLAEGGIVISTLEPAGSKSLEDVFLSLTDDPTGSPGERGLGAEEVS